ncbi:MAG: BamA/TamA family outer membrane protein, partial [Bacteroidota bacterium]|nr:BamA/TamA family outer membrane protein [Bacteroidota bacterium]
IWVRNAYSGGFKSVVRPGTDEHAKDFIQRIEADIAWYRRLFRSTVLAVSVHGRELRGSELDVSDYYFLGGANTLRGYREEQFAGSRTAWANLECRYLFASRSNVYAFFDFGYVFLAGDSGKQREEFRILRDGYGIGVRLETVVGIFSVSYALGKGDAVSNGKIHFGIENTF